MSEWRIVIDQEICVGSGTCASAAPAYFALDDNDKSSPLQQVVRADEDVAAAAEMCPTAAIRVTDTASGRPVAGL